MILIPCLEHEKSIPFWNVITETSFLLMNSINLYGALARCQVVYQATSKG